MSTAFHQLTIKEKIQETADTVSLKFETPQDLKDDFIFQAGQYLTLRFDINGQDVRRAYSMSSSPIEKDITITIKRVAGGLVSNYIHDQIHAGDNIAVMPPQGKFVPQLDIEHRKTYYLFGVGSGITPLISIIKTVLEEEPQSTVFLYYGNRSEAQIIFKTQLEQLSSTYKGQFFVTHILSQPTKIKAGGLAGMFGKKQSLWLGETGRIDANKTRIFLKKHSSTYSNAAYFICGPETMISNVEQALIAEGASKSQIHFELFNTTNNNTSTNSSTSSDHNCEAIVHLNGKSITLSIPSDQTILDALIAQKEDAPYSCMSGSCSSCIAKVTAGSVKMEVCYALDDDEIEEGYILSCQAKPTSPAIEVDFNDV